MPAIAVLLPEGSSTISTLPVLLSLNTAPILFAPLGSTIRLRLEDRPRDTATSPLGRAVTLMAASADMSRSSLSRWSSMSGDWRVRVALRLSWVLTVANCLASVLSFSTPALMASRVSVSTLPSWPASSRKREATWSAFCKRLLRRSVEAGWAETARAAAKNWSSDGASPDCALPITSMTRLAYCTKGPCVLSVLMLPRRPDSANSL